MGAQAQQFATSENTTQGGAAFRQIHKESRYTYGKLSYDPLTTRPLT